MRHKILTAILGILLLIILIAALSDSDQDSKEDNGTRISDTTKDTNVTSTPKESKKEDANENKETVTEAPTAAPVDELEDVTLEYTLTSGYYTAGIDLPIGKCDIEAVKGKGNVSSSNLLSGGINEMFGIDDGSGLYTDSFQGLRMDEKVTLNVSGGVTIKLLYTNITRKHSGRNYNEEKAFELSSGNYVAGVDFPAGTYNMEAVKGQGNVSSSNIFDGGINEMVGEKDQSGLYIQTFQNLQLTDQVELSISGGVTIRLIPQE
jgi:hypothetical protein